MEDEELSERERRDIADAKARIESRFQRIIDRYASEEDVKREYPDEVRLHMEAEAARAKEERAENIRRSRLQKWDEKVPEVWKGWSIDMLPLGFQNQCLEWLATGFDNAQNILIYGGTGTGKTTMAYALSREIYAQGYKAKMWDIRELLAAINPKAPSAAQTLESAKTHPLLLLDDIGSEKKSEWTNDRLLEIIDYRWQWKKPTIVTTNLLLDGTDDRSLQGWLGDRAYSRLSSGAMKLRAKGNDKRV